MNNNNSADENFEFVRVHLQLKENHIDFLRGIDPDNQSKAARQVFDKAINQTRINRVRESLLYVVFGLCILILVMLLLPFI